MRFANLLTLSLLLGICLLFTARVYAQPPLDQATLTVTVVDAAGNPTAYNMKATLTPAGVKTALNERPTVTNTGVEFVSLTAGDYLLRISSPPALATDNPIPLTLEPGPNVYEIHLEEMSSVAGILALPTPAGGTTTDMTPPAQPNPATVQVCLLEQDKADPSSEMRLTVSPVITPGHWQIAGLGPGDYHLYMLTDLGYGDTSFKVKDGDKTVDGGTITLKPGTVFTLTLENADATPVVGARVTLRPAFGNTKITLTATTDEKGKAIFLPVPSGKCAYAYSLKGIGKIGSGSIVADGTPRNITVVLPKTPLVPPPAG